MLPQFTFKRSQFALWIRSRFALNNVAEYGEFQLWLICNNKKMKYHHLHYKTITVTFVTCLRRSERNAHINPTNKCRRHISYAKPCNTFPFVQIPIQAHFPYHLYFIEEKIVFNVLAAYFVLVRHATKNASTQKILRCVTNVWYFIIMIDEVL